MKAKKRLCIAGMVIGGFLSLSPFWGMLGTVFGMMHAFKTLGNAGVSDPRALADSIGTTLTSTALGLLLFPVGVVILILSIIFYDRLRKAAPPPMPLTATLP